MSGLPNINALPFGVGDLVRIKSLEQLESEYGVNRLGTILTPSYSFPRAMRYLCGKEFHIKEIVKSRTCTGVFRFRSDEGIENIAGQSGQHWFIGPEMIEPVEEDYEDISDVDLNCWATMIQ